MTDRQGIEIDYCPKCRGVWLDRGELDKLIERSTQYEAGLRGRDRDDDDDDDDDRRKHDSPRHHSQPGYGQPGYGAPPYPPQQPYYKKRKSFWSELFD
jgi:Zn-finger nucleic acid-binding protein